MHMLVFLNARGLRGFAAEKIDTQLMHGCVKLDVEIDVHTALTEQWLKLL